MEILVQFNQYWQNIYSANYKNEYIKNELIKINLIDFLEFMKLAKKDLPNVTIYQIKKIIEI